RPLTRLSRVLSYSRRIFLRFCLNAQMDSFLRGHVEAFAAFGGLARTLLYDNLKASCLNAVAVARGNQKGRIEQTAAAQALIAAERCPRAAVALVAQAGPRRLRVPRSAARAAVARLRPGHSTRPARATRAPAHPHPTP